VKLDVQQFVSMLERRAAALDWTPNKIDEFYMNADRIADLDEVEVGSVASR
jgi:hypothetical protein